MIIKYIYKRGDTMKREKLFKKYYKSPYHDYELSDTMQFVDDTGRSPDIAFIYSGRNRGKSYEVAMQCLADAWYDGKKFAYVRRHKATAYQIESYFADKTDLIHDMTDGAADGVGYFRGNIYLYKISEDNGKNKRDHIMDIGYFFALSGQGNHKSEQYPDCYNMIYEEVLTLDPYLPGEPEMLLGLRSTLERNKKGFKTNLISNTVTIVNPYSKAWSLSFGKTKPDEVRLTKLYLGAYDENGDERYYLIAGHYLKDKNELTKDDLAKNRNRVKSSIATNRWDEAKLFPTIPLTFIRDYDIVDTVIFEWDDVMMQGNIIEVPVNLREVYLYDQTPSDQHMPMLYVRRKTTEPKPGTRIYTNSPDRFNDIMTKGFKRVYKIDIIIENLMSRGWVIGADNLTMNDFDNIWRKLKILS